MNLARTLGSVGGLTLVSRVLALVRDSLQATFVGAGFASDAFLVAFRLPNMFRALFAEGAFSAAFIPMFNKRVAEGGGPSAGFLFAERALSVLFPVLALFTVAMLIAAWPVTWALSGGFNDPSPSDFAYAVTLSRITIPYLFLISLVSLLGGILNSLDRFWVNAAAPILLNLAMVAGLLFFHGENPYETARVQAISVTAGGALQLLWLIFACRSAGVKLRLRLPKIDDDVRQLMKLMLPAALGAGATQINLLISTALAGSMLAAGSISYIYYADRLNQLPLGLIGIGLGTILLPTISRLLSSGKDAEAMETQNRGIELALFLTLPAMVALMVAAEPIIRGLFQHGAFTADDTMKCAWALSAFSVGLPAYVLVKVLTPGYYARQDTKTPVRYAMISIVVNIVGNLILIPLIGHVGPPLATALAALVNVVMLYVTLRKRGHFEADAQLVRRLPRLALAAILMGVAIFGLDRLLDPYLTGTLVMRILALGVLVAGGTAIYGIACFVTRAFTLGDLKSLARKRRPSDPIQE
ncbi:murein biosynthesis integral membrane protein MurJ [Sphingomonas sp. G-3-2-10]|uniref:murein biosynthesis integral membrane protein MurJ n=1 Tax=Sphingomonas sp. G-3-2-10 TaxID=2728838 RepID=UPI00146CF7E4|nr:murein biosynthesis integral membrane protein MurJ [Sphingomonas sp. G-3-2-10]NML04224.1 murein biosynthesis integral membrane protein MurJ [Sphingomonas sp. G-3-2-10]